MEAPRRYATLIEADVNRHGGKAARLSRLIAAGAPTPPGAAFADDADEATIRAALSALEAEAGRAQDDPADPLLLALRSSPIDPEAPAAAAILNIGLTNANMDGVAARIGARAAADLRRRQIAGYAASAMGADPEAFEMALEEAIERAGADGEEGLDETALTMLSRRFLELVEEETGDAFPDDGFQQLLGAASALRRGWDAPTARILRAARGADAEAGQSLIAQEMALGLGDGPSGAGTMALRDETTGAVGVDGRFLLQAQGADALLGLRTPQLVSREARERQGQTRLSLEEEAPGAFAALRAIAERAERVFGDALTLEFTLESGDVRILDAQPLKAKARAAIRIAVELAESGAISRDDALLRIEPTTLVAHLHPSIALNAPRDVVGCGLPASPGAASGAIAFSAEGAEALAAREQSAILVRVETSPEDIRGMHAATGVLTTRGGMTSHAAVIARGLGAPCVVGVSDLSVDFDERTLTSTEGRVFREGDVITLDGSAGEVLAGAPDLIRPEISGSFARLMEWADATRRMRVRANADTVQDASVAIGFDVDGIGLCRTEHMFFERGRLTTMRRMILASDEAARREALDALLPMQREDFVKLFKIMAGLPVTIRLLDPPLHEFLPHGRRELEELAAAMELPLATVARRADELSEFNPMLGRRGCRVGVSFPEIYEMQARAVFEAAVEAGDATGEPVIPEIMIPLISANREMELLGGMVARIAEEVRRERGVELTYRIGAMVETPRAALRAEDIVSTAEFLSFGTNDLTQMTYGLSRDDAGRFMREYVSKRVFANDPFHTLDVEGVGELLLLAAERGRAGRRDLTLGLCGEHGGDPASIRFCELAGFDYISCSPFRLPIARLAAAQARLLAGTSGDSR